MVRHDECFGNSVIDSRPDKFTFTNAGSFRHPRQVHNVIPGDFTQDGTLDLLVVADGIAPNTLSMSVYTGNIGGGFGQSA
jgi:integrin alpha FG-GAP repeat containing protein 1